GGGGGAWRAAGVAASPGRRGCRPGASRRRPDWRAWSRGQGLHSKSFAEPQHESQWLTLEQAPGPTLEHQLGCLTGWILQLEQRQQPYGLVIPGTRLAPATGAADRDNCLRALALYG